MDNYLGWNKLLDGLFGLIFPFFVYSVTWFKDLPGDEMQVQVQ